MPNKVQKLNSEFLECDQKTASALTELEEMFSNTNNNNLNEAKIKKLVDDILVESANAKSITENLEQTLNQDEQTAELYRTNFLREWLLGEQDASTSSDDSDDSSYRGQAGRMTLESRRVSITSVEDPIRPP